MWVERLNLDIRQRVAAVGRRGTTLGQGEDGIQPQLALVHVCQNCVRPHASLRQPRPVPQPTNGRGSVKQGQPCTLAMAAGRTEQGGGCKKCCSTASHRGHNLIQYKGLTRSMIVRQVKPGVLAIRLAGLNEVLTTRCDW